MLFVVGFLCGALTVFMFVRTKVLEGRKFETLDWEEVRQKIGLQVALELHAQMSRKEAFYEEELAQLKEKVQKRNFRKEYDRKIRKAELPP